jgi:NifU-like protein involved in Fe-S cluster formation
MVESGAMTYSSIVMHHFYAPRNHYRMERPDVVGTAGNPARGDFMQIFLRLGDERIIEASFQTIGCCPAIAAGSLLAARLAGATREEALVWTEEAINAVLGGLPAEKRYCSALAAEALRDAVGYWTKRPSKRAATADGIETVGGDS